MPLGRDAMVMGLCQTCDSTHYEPVEGTSPLQIRLDDLDDPVPDEHVVHIYTYNPALYAHQDPLVLHASTDQDVRVSGTLTLEVPPQ